MRACRRGPVWAAIALLLWGPAPTGRAERPDRDYWVYVASESEDEVSRIRFGPGGALVESTVAVGVRPTDIEGPHGLAISPDGQHWYVSLAHGNPFGTVYKYRTGTDERAGSVEVGMFPATLDIARSTGLLYVVNFDLHGDMAPSTLSVVETESMREVARVEVGIMPHGSRLNSSGSRQYSVMMMTDELVETDAFGFEVLRRLSLSETAHDAHGAGDGMAARARPTWVEPDPADRFAYVISNGTNEVKEVDLERWQLTRTLATAPGPYNADLTPDGRLLVVTYRIAGSTGIWDIREGRELVRIENSRPLPHGVAISPDGRYAFVSVEGVGGEPGAVDVIDIEAAELVSTVEVGKQASGIAFWKME